MFAPAVARRGLVALMNAVPASAAARFDTFARSARVLRRLDAEGRKAEHCGLNRWGERGKMFKVEGDARVTRVGAFLRRYSLDELPQLINVLRGQIALIAWTPPVLFGRGHEHSL